MSSTTEEEGVEEKNSGWFDVLTTPLNACSLETYFPIPQDDGNDNTKAHIPLVVGCYQLNESSQVDDPEDVDTASSSVASSRCGELRLHMVPTPSTSKTEMQFGDAACVLQMESGVLDGKWKRRKRSDQSEDEAPLFASACASGNIHIHVLEKMCTDSTTKTTSWRLNHFASTDAQSDSGLCLALAWNDYLNESGDQLVSSYSKGEVAIHEISYFGDTNEVPKLEETHRWNAHTLFGCPSEVWTCSFLRGAESVVLSGADDCSMKVWDIRQTQRPVHKVGDTEFEAGVTAISSHPSIDGIFAVGSYDEHVRLYDYRKMNQPLSKVSVGGGVWRIKWHPSTWSGESISCRGKLLVAAMHGGCRVVNFPSLNHDLEEYTIEEADVKSEFTAHKSMAYGADWISFGTSKLEAAASCSFYDRKAFIWDPNC